MIEALWEPERLAAGGRPEPPAAAEPSPGALVIALRRGEATAFEALYRLEVRWLYALALRLCCRPAEAEELTQESFVRAWEARASFLSHAHFRNWLRRVTVNEWINRVRKHRPLALDDEDNAALAATVSSPPGTPGLRLDLERALARLTPRLRAVLLLFDLHGLDHAEIGELLGMTVGASKVQLHRARRRLRELMT